MSGAGPEKTQSARTRESRRGLVARMPTAMKKIHGSVLAAEALAIVASILFAFAIDAWWDERSDRKLLDNALVNLQSELRSNIEMIDRFMQLHQEIVDAGVSLLEAPPEDITAEQLGNVFASGWVTDYSMGALDVLLGNTRLDLIDDDALRAAIVALPVRYEDALEDERWAIDQLMQTWVPYISTVVPVASLWDVALPSLSFPVSQDIEEVDISSAVATLEFRNHVTNRIGFELLSIVAQRELRATLEATVAGIEEAMAR